MTQLLFYPRPKKYIYIMKTSPKLNRSGIWHQDCSFVLKSSILKGNQKTLFKLLLVLLAYNFDFTQTPPQGKFHLIKDLKSE